MPNRNTPAAEETALATVESQTALAVVQDILATVPQADTDPTERMTQFILTQPAEKWEGLWAGLPSIRDYAGRVILVHDFRARESDFEGPLSVYFILDATDVETGAHELISCSSQMSMIQLLALRRDGRLPAAVEVVRKEKATKRGFHPIHLRYLVNYRDPVVSEQ